MTALKNVAALCSARAGGSVSLDCPECGNAGPHDTNDDHREPTALCEACGYQFDVIPAVSCRDCESIAEDGSRYCRSCGPRRAGEEADRRHARA